MISNRRAALLALVATVAAPLFAQTSSPALGIETGIASWYGDAFHGKKTANGEFFDMNAMTAAHKVLPFGTLVLVTNLSNGRRVVVRVNDRGPFVAGRIIDLSKAAAAAIGLDLSGTARVEIRAVPAGTAVGPYGADPAAPDVATSGTRSVPLKTTFPDEVGTPSATGSSPRPAVALRIQVGSFKDGANAASAVERLATLGLSAVVETAGPYHRVVLYVSSADRDRVEAVLDAAGWKDRLVKEVSQ